MSRLKGARRSQAATTCAPRARTGCGETGHDKGRLRTFGAVVRTYVHDYRHAARSELGFYRGKPFGRAVELAALAHGPHGKLRHQWRIPPRLLARWAQLLRTRGDVPRRSPDL